MEILFLTVYSIKTLECGGLYEDLLNKFRLNGHHVTIVTPSDETTSLERYEGYSVLRVKTPSFQKTNYLLKSISTVLLPLLYRNAIRSIDYKHFALVLYSTPPITLVSVIKYIKKKTNATSFLLLKDIWPQGVVDVGAIKKNGLIWRYFRAKEKKMYAVSDFIGCTSRANIEYIVSHNNDVAHKTVIVTNGLSSDRDYLSKDIRTITREKYGLPLDQIILFYGGNLGSPQDIPFVIKCIEACSDLKDVHFVICGKGTQSSALVKYVGTSNMNNLTLLDYLPQNEYENVVASVDVCLVFLNHRFTVPNCPARFYAYMKHSKPVIACTDKATDIRLDIINGEFGWWCYSVDENEFKKCVKSACSADLLTLGQNARRWFEKYYTTDTEYDTIIKKVNG